MKPLATDGLDIESIRAKRQAAFFRENNRKIGEQMVAYGATCTWWDMKTRAATSLANGMPCCPHCAGPLFEAPVKVFLGPGLKERDDHDPGYADFIMWLRGYCYRSGTLELSFQEARTDYDNGVKWHTITSRQNGKTRMREEVQQMGDYIVHDFIEEEE